MPPITLAAPSAMTKGQPVAPWLRRLVGKFALDVMPTAVASVIGTILLSHYGFNRPIQQPPAAQAAPASAEMLAMVHDEHALIMNYLHSQIAAERNRQAAEDADSAKAVASAKALELKSAQIAVAAASAAAAAPHSAATAVSKPVRVKTAVASVAPSLPAAPLVIAQAQPQAPLGREDRLARDPDSLLAKTLDMKDHVVDHVVTATRSVVSAIGDVFTSVGDHISGALPGGHQQFSSAS